MSVPVPNWLGACASSKESHENASAMVPVTDDARNRLFNTLREKLGAEDAATMMELLPPVGWADVARRSDLDGLERRLDARVDGVERRLDARIDGVERRLDARIDSLGVRMDGLEASLGARMDGLEHRMDRLEQRMESLERALRDQTRFLATTLVAAMVAMTGIFGLIVHL